jgi:uncharacterized protein DUF1344
MKRLVTLMIAVTLAALAFAPLAWAAANVQGKIKAMDTTGRTLVLEDGTQLAIPDNLPINRKDLQPGTEVKASYDMIGGQKVITAIEVTPTRSK